jgi:prophage antirepressor-like protein
MKDSVFQFDGAVVRTFADAQREPWFNVSDICAVLGYRNSRDAVAKHCNPKGVAKRDTLTDGGNQELLFINEGNLYRLIRLARTRGV